MYLVETRWDKHDSTIFLVKNQIMLVEAQEIKSILS